MTLLFRERMLKCLLNLFALNVFSVLRLMLLFPMCLVLKLGVLNVGIERIFGSLMFRDFLKSVLLMLTIEFPSSLLYRLFSPL